MLFLPSNENRVPDSPAGWPGSPPNVQHLWDGLASRQITFSTNSLNHTITWPWGEDVNVFALAGFSSNKPLSYARINGNDLVTSGHVLWSTLGFDRYTGITLSLQAASSDTVYRIGEVIAGSAAPLPDPSSYRWDTSIPSIANGDYVSIVGVPRATITLTFPPDATPRMEQFLRQRGGQTGLLVFENHGVFGRWGTSVSYLRTVDDTYYHGIQLTFTELEGGSLWGQ